LEINIKTDVLKAAISTLGCKLNQAESEVLAAELTAAGYHLVDFSEVADLYVVNSCTVTHVADRKSRQMLRAARRLNPQAKIVALGCYAGLPEHPLDSLPEVDLVIDNTDKGRVVEILKQKGWLAESRPALDSTHAGRTRSFIKAQDGCNNFCTYCIVPFVRGREKSLSPEEVIGQIRQRTEQGFREVVLTGTEIGRYSSQNMDIVALLRRILNETEIGRLRLSSLQPQEITPELLALWQNPRLCPHFHLSLQSGSDSVLARMQRRYTTEVYADKVTHLRVLIPDVSITTDIIVGFPGEDDQEFRDSYDFARRMRFSRTHVFSYSPRRGTRAAEMPKQISSEVKKERSRQMIELGKISLERYHNTFIGSRREVLFEQTASGIASGYTDNYIKVYIKNRTDLTNQVLPVILLRTKADGMEGDLDL
jgi:threonylcarbamoyladenosine tRNA methylthiotransferase MtaB